MERRKFLQASMAASFVSTFSFPSLAFPSMASKLDPIPLSISFLGTTYSHGAAKLKIVQRSPHWKLIGAHDETEEGKKLCDELKVPLISLEKALTADVVAIESEVLLHSQHAIVALRAGKHIHLEKPPGTRREDIATIFDLARSKNLLVQTGYMWRYNPGFQALFEIVKNGWLGQVTLIRGHVSNSLPLERRAEWGKLPGGSMFELGSHLIDAVVRLQGKPDRIVSSLRNVAENKDELLDTNVLIFEYPKCTAVLTNSAMQPKSLPNRSFELIGTQGSAVLSPLEQPVMSLDLVSAAGPYPAGPSTHQFPFYHRYEADLEELANAVRGDGKLLVDLDTEEQIAMTLIDAVSGS